MFFLSDLVDCTNFFRDFPLEVKNRKKAKPLRERLLFLVDSFEVSMGN